MVAICVGVVVGVILSGIFAVRVWWRKKKPGFNASEFESMTTSIRTRIGNTECTKSVKMTGVGRTGLRFEYADSEATQNTKAYIHTLCTSLYPLFLSKSESTNGTVLLEYRKYIPPIHPKIGFFLLFGGVLFIAGALLNLILSS